MPISTLDTSNTSTVTVRQHAIKTNEVIGVVNPLSANVTSIQAQKAANTYVVAQLALKANTTMLNSKANTVHTHTYASLTSKPTTLSGFSVTSLDLGTNPNTFKANTTIVRVKSTSANTTISSSLVQINNGLKTASMSQDVIQVGNSTFRTYQDLSKYTVIAPTANTEITTGKVRVRTSTTDAHMTPAKVAVTSSTSNTNVVSTGVVVKSAVANTNLSSTGLTLSNTSVSFSITKPTAVQVSAANYFLASDGVWKVVGGTAPTIQVFTSSGTWNPPVGLKGIKVTVVGGGGGTAPSPSSATGGGGGGSAIKVIASPLVSSPVTVTVGAGGPTTAPSAGGTSSFGPFVSATGGAAGASPTTTAVSGGTGTGGDVNIPGGEGGRNWSGTAQNTAVGKGGDGGSTILGMGGQGAFDITGSPTPSPQSAQYPSIAGSGYGAGASGKAGTPTGVAGTAGIVIVEEFY